MDIASLGIQIDASSADRANQSLDGLTDAARRTESAAAGAGQAWQQAAERMQDSRSASAMSAHMLEQSNAALRAQQQELAKLIGQIDPVVGALGRLDEMQERLQGFRTSGLIDAESFQQYNSQIEVMRQRLGATDADLERVGITAKQSAASLRMLPAQFTDIAVSLQAGQSPLTVLLQQGGQLKDMFGGAGPAAKAMAGYILGLVNPFTVAAAAIGSLSLAYYQGSQEADGYRNALILTGNAAGTTAERLADAARRIDGLVGTERQAAQVLAQVAGVSSFTADQIDRVGLSAIAMSEATGRAVSETVSEFEKLAKEPVKASAELNEKYNYLTASVYQQIQALNEQGDTVGAATLAINTYADAMDKRSAQITENLGTIERAWKGVKDIAAEAWDAMLDVGREETLEQRIAELQKLIASAEKGNKKTRGRRGQGAGNLEEMRADLKVLEEQKKQQEEIARQEGERAEANAKAIKGMQLISKEYEAAGSTVDRLRKRIEELNKARDANVAVGAWSSEAQSQYDKAVEDINRKIAEAQARSVRKTRDDAATRLLLQLRQQQASLSEQLGTVERISKEEQALARFNQQIADLKEKKILTAEQQSLLANESAIRAELEKSVALRSQIEAREELVKLQTVEQALAASLIADQQRYADQLAAFGLGDRAREQLRSQEQLYRDYQQQMQRAARDRARGEIISDDLYRQQTEAIKRSLDERLAAQQDYYRQLEKEQGDWTNGASEAWQNYLDSARDVAGQTENLFSNAFRGMEDAVVEFAMTGKLSFADFAKSVLADMARIAARQAVTGIAANLFSSVVGAYVTPGGVTTSTSGFSEGYFSSVNAKGNAFFGGEVVPFAKGGAFTNALVDSPTLFPMSAGRTGLMGEAGPEAIMPLTRAPDGSLGVRSMGSSGSSATIIQISAPVTIEGGQADTAGLDTAQLQAGLETRFRQVAQEELAKSWRAGGQSWRAVNGRG